MRGLGQPRAVNIQTSRSVSDSTTRKDGQARNDSVSLSLGFADLCEEEDR